MRKELAKLKIERKKWENANKIKEEIRKERLKLKKRLRSFKKNPKFQEFKKTATKEAVKGFKSFQKYVDNVKV